MNVALLLANWIKVLKQTQLGHEIVAKKYMKLPVLEFGTYCEIGSMYIKKLTSPKQVFEKHGKRKLQTFLQSWESKGPTTQCHLAPRK